MFNKIKSQRRIGFTFAEMLLIVATIAILVGIVIIAINPPKKPEDVRNSQRSVDVTTIVNGVYQHSVDNDGTLLASITTTATEICATGALSCKGLVDLTSISASGKYFNAIPKDPQCAAVCAANGVGYKIAKDASGHLIVTAPFAEQGRTISVAK